MIWRPSTRKFKLNEFLARLRRQPGIIWQPDAFHKKYCRLFRPNHQSGEGQATYKNVSKKIKPLFVYALQISSFSFHIAWIDLRASEEISSTTYQGYDEFISLANNLMKRLLAHGYHAPILKSTLDLLAKPKYRHKKDHLNRSLFFSLEYNPNGPTNQLIRRILQLDSLEKMLTPLWFGNNIIIGLRRARNLREILCSTSRIAPTPSHAVQS